MSGFEAELAALGVTAGVLGSAAESLSAAVDGLSGCAELGPGRLDEVAGALVADTRAELAGVFRAVAADAELVRSVRDGYAEVDENAGARFRELGPW
ncbi:hypothetical protein [Actinophytocola xanthii]|uniref:ESX-1 secretion-associated protein n=1 Tax=Actinophytocola xanthii TaxID=1912961 RepID=A0A1Q8CMV2_9PSEU|nr:hypothetical protein [Actinophytocola xanthii]OLF15692.1 hypothetical protein BU204_19915 [Actinophytocola xanthii]